MEATKIKNLNQKLDSDKKIYPINSHSTLNHKSRIWLCRIKWNPILINSEKVGPWNSICSICAKLSTSVNSKSLYGITSIRKYLLPPLNKVNKRCPKKLCQIQTSCFSSTWPISCMTSIQMEASATKQFPSTLLSSACCILQMSRA